MVRFIPRNAEQPLLLGNGSPALAELAEQRLRSNSYLALWNVSCDCRDGRLSLHGWVPTFYLKQIAQTVVAEVAGSCPINNEIEVKGLAGGR
jgi:hypothetical protein